MGQHITSLASNGEDSFNTNQLETSLTFACTASAMVTKSINIRPSDPQPAVPDIAQDAQLAEEALLDAMLYSSALKDLLSGKW